MIGRILMSLLGGFGTLIGLIGIVILFIKLYEWINEKLGDGGWAIIILLLIGIFLSLGFFLNSFIK